MLLNAPPWSDEFSYFQLIFKIFQNSKEIFPAHLKYILPTSVKMRVFNIESFLCTFHRTVWVLCYFALLQEHKKEIMYFLPIAIKVESSSLHLLFTAFHLDPLEGLKALLFIWSSGKRFFFLSEVDSNVLKRVAIYYHYPLVFLLFKNYALRNEELSQICSSSMLQARKKTLTFLPIFRNLTKTSPRA